jgi:peptide/nickel transport system substrate-binding protein
MPNDTVAARNSVPISRRLLLAGSAGLAATLAAPRLLHAADATAVLAIDSDPPTLNLGMTTGYAAGDVGAKIMEGLIWLDRNYAPQPSLATSWNFSPDGKTYTFHLRPGVKWHDGQDFSSADVAYTFTEILAKLHPRASAMLKRVNATIETPDALTVVFHLEHPYAPFMEQLTVFDAPILPRHIYEGKDVTSNPANQHPIGTGPFVFTSWQRGAAIRVTRNPNYWGAPKPGLDGIVFQIIPQPANRMTELQTGEVDEVVDYYMPKSAEPRLLLDTRLQHRQGINIPAFYFLMFNTTRAPFSDEQVRQAFAFAIDRDRLVKQAMNGLASPGYGAFGDGFPWLLDEADDYAHNYPLDPAKARAMLASAGWKGSSAPVLIYEAGRPQMIATAQIVRENLQAIGMDVQLEPLERAVMLDKVYTHRDFDLTLQSYFSAGDPAIGYHRLYLTENGRPQFTNASGYSSPVVDRLLGEAATEPERNKRANLYRQAQRILNAALPSLVLYDEKTVDFATTKLKNIWPALDPRDQWAGVAMA